MPSFESKIKKKAFSLLYRKKSQRCSFQDQSSITANNYFNSRQHPLHPYYPQSTPCMVHMNGPAPPSSAGFMHSITYNHNAPQTHRINETLSTHNLGSVGTHEPMIHTSHDLNVHTIHNGQQNNHPHHPIGGLSISGATDIGGCVGGSVGHGNAAGMGISGYGHHANHHLASSSVQPFITPSMMPNHYSIADNDNTAALLLDRHRAQSHHVPSSVHHLSTANLSSSRPQTSPIMAPSYSIHGHHNRNHINLNSNDHVLPAHLSLDMNFITSSSSQSMDDNCHHRSMRISSEGPASTLAGCSVVDGINVVEPTESALPIDTIGMMAPENITNGVPGGAQAATSPYVNVEHIYTNHPNQHQPQQNYRFSSSLLRNHHFTATDRCNDSSNAISALHHLNGNDLDFQNNLNENDNNIVNNNNNCDTVDSDTCHIDNLAPPYRDPPDYETFLKEKYNLTNAQIDDIVAVLRYNLGHPSNPSPGPI